MLVLAPTRELAKQTANVFSDLSSRLSVLAVYGGTPYGPQGKLLFLLFNYTVKVVLTGEV